MKTVLGIFNDRSDVEDAIDRLETSGFRPQDVSIVMKNEAEAEEMHESTGANIAEGAVSGATTGAVLGGLAGLVGAFVLPGIGAFFIGGPIATALGLTGAAASTLSGAVTGAAAGGLIGALMGLGLSEDDAEYYEDRVRSGAILVAVPAGNDEAETVVDIFDEYDASDVKSIDQGEDRIVEDKAVFADSKDQPMVSHVREHTRGYATVGAKGGRTRRIRK